MMRFEIAEKPLVRDMYWRPGFAWLPVEATQGPALPNVMVWLEPVGVHSTFVGATLKGFARYDKTYCTKERMERDNEFPNSTGTKNG